MDYGRKYMNRIFFYSSTFLIVYLIYAILLILSYFGIMIAKVDSILYVMATFDVTYVITILCIMLVYGAEVNK